MEEKNKNFIPNGIFFIFCFGFLTTVFCCKLVETRWALYRRRGRVDEETSNREEDEPQPPPPYSKDGN